MKSLVLNNLPEQLGNRAEVDGKAKYLLIAEALRQAIKHGQVMPGELLPSARKLAKDLAVNRHTIMAAFAELVAQGWVEAKQRAGYCVAHSLPIQASTAARPVNAVKKGFEFEFRCQFTLLQPRLKKASQYRYNFSGGQPDIREFPFNDFKRHFSTICQRPSYENLGYGDSYGEPELITQISQYLRRVRGITDKPLMICNGSQEALYMVAQLLLKAGDKVAVERLGYPPAWSTFARTGATLVAIKQDAKGLDPKHLADVFAQGDIKLLYLTPLHQYPTTVSLDISRRMQIYQLAADYGVAIIEDDYDHEFHYQSQPIVPMAADDPAGLVIYISTFSKLMFGGARIGYVAASKPFIEQLAAYKAMINHKTNALIQQCVAQWMRTGGFESHLRRMTKLYLTRRDYMVAVLKTYQAKGLPLHFEVPAGGMAIWLDTGKSVIGLKEQLFSEQVYLQTEVEFDVSANEFNGFSCNAVNHKNRDNSMATNKNNQQPLRFIRLGFASMNETEVDQGLRILMRNLYGKDY